MPAKNSTKTYLESGYYHLYNRGVEKRLIFLDQQDYGVFLSYLKEYLLPKEEEKLREKLADSQVSSVERNKLVKKLTLNNFYNEITLLAYCLMPNHFHLFIKQKTANAIDRFMQSLCTRYAIYFNKKYKRVGSLYQGVYKAVLITTEEQFLYLSKYIHKQSLALQGVTLQAHLQAQQPSSYAQYLELIKTSWVHPEEVLSYFSKTNLSLSYESFVKESDKFDLLTDLTLEES